MKVLIVGSDSQIGGAVARQLEAEGHAVAKTAFRRPLQEGEIFLDLSDEPSSWPPLPPSDVTYLFAAVTSLAECRRNPERSRLINVDHTVALAERAIRGGSFVVFSSTSLVFDGSKPFRRDDEPVCPITEYGRQKAEAERRLLAHEGHVGVVRLTKVIGPDTPLFREWARALKGGQAIHPFSDMVMAPISLSFAVRVLIEVGRRRLAGITHVSADRDITYAEAGSHFARGIGASETLVQPVRSREAGFAGEAIPCYTTLDCSRWQRVLGISIPSPLDAIDAVSAQAAC